MFSSLAGPARDGAAWAKPRAGAKRLHGHTLLSPQAARGIEEDFRVHHFPAHVAVAITPAGEGDDDPVGQHGQGIGDELLLQLVSGGQVPEQP